MFKRQTISRRASQEAFWLFMIGCFSMTQLKLGAKIGISEVGCLFATPFLFFRDYPLYKRDGVLSYFTLALLWLAGALFSDFYNHSSFEQIIRGFSVPLTVFACSVCIYHFLRRNPDNLKWLLFGIAVSSVISIFVFQRGSAGDLAAEGDMSRAIESVVGYKLFWVTTIKTWLILPIQTIYLKLPSVYVIPAMICVAVVSAKSGGRSAFAMTILGLALLMIGGKQVVKMRRIKRFLPILILIMVGMMSAIKSAYSYAATHGYLSDAETVKYQRQTTHGSDIKSLLMSGRGDFFIGLIAALDKPLVGHGSRAMDFHGYERDFLQKYGTLEEVDRYNKNIAQGYLHGIRAHSHVISFWMWHGLAGLIFWVYVFYLVVQTVRKRIDLIPEWFGFLAVALSEFLWDYFFSPFGLRVSECALFCALLVLVRVERMRKFGLGYGV